MSITMAKINERPSIIPTSGTKKTGGLLMSAEERHINNGGYQTVAARMSASCAYIAQAIARGHRTPDQQFYHSVSAHLPR